ncbi:MAG: response regulator [Alicyclobacillaceae bacterium]|nr:response regulator [Alicyclobacillaceae bacterium]
MRTGETACRKKLLIESHSERKGVFSVAKIMIVDDAAFMRMMLKNILAEDGHEIVGEAMNGKQAVELYGQLQPDIVIMDITMPEMDGIQATGSIKSLYPDAKIIMCSAMGQQQMVIDAIQNGARGFIVKPFQKERVLEEVRKIAGGAR